MLTSQQISQFDDQGFLIFKQLFSNEEVAFLTDHYMRMSQPGSRQGDAFDLDPSSGDPLKRFPRMLQMHRGDPVSLNWLLDPRIAQTLTALMRAEPFAVQTMIYFKPPRARGQALHQDQYYLRVQPGTCVAAWMALDRCDEENGCLRVVAGSQNWPLLCTIQADLTQSFTDVTVPIPEGSQIVPVLMDAGDVLFFNGQVVHGSGPNHSADRFRRSLIGHYIAGEASQVAKYYHPALRMDGSQVDLTISDGGGTCGIWVDQDGKPVIEMAGVEGLAGRTE